MDASQPQHWIYRIKPAQGVKNLIIQGVALQSLESNIHIMVIIKSEEPPMFCPACNLNGSLAIFGCFRREKAMSYSRVPVKRI